MIAEIAESQNSILVKVESAKAARRFQKPDWLNYTDAPHLWAPATWEDFDADAAGEKSAALKSIEAIDGYIEKMQKPRQATSGQWELPQHNDYCVDCDSFGVRTSTNP